MSFWKGSLAVFRPRRTARVSFQILSDLHLEVGQQYDSFTVPVRAPYLILAGDIGRLSDYEGYLEFLVKQCAVFQLVFLVLGNHEFFGGTHAGVLASAFRLESEPSLNGRLVVLHRRRFDLKADGNEEVVILGATLHSHIPPDAEATVMAKVNDFRRIEGWSVKDHNNAHEMDLAWFKDELRTLAAEARDRGLAKKVLVVTHYPPCIEGTSHPKHAANPWNSAFATDILEDLQREGTAEIDCWVFGHTHYSTQLDDVQGVYRLLANQRGYVLPGRDEAIDKEKKKPTPLDRWKHRRAGRYGSPDAFDIEKIIAI